MDRMILLFLVGLLAAGTAFAATYSCRDNRGQLHFADSPANLPAECLGKEKLIDLEKSENLNMVPATAAPPESEEAFADAVRSVENEQQQLQQQLQDLHLRAKQLVKKYREAVVAKRNAQRSWSYSSREQMDLADRQIEEARTGKQQLLQELEDGKIAADDEHLLRQELEAIGEE